MLHLFECSLPPNCTESTEGTCHHSMPSAAFCHASSYCQRSSLRLFSHLMPLPAGHDEWVYGGMIVVMHGRYGVWRMSWRRDRSCRCCARAGTRAAMSRCPGKRCCHLRLVPARHLPPPPDIPQQVYFCPDTLLSAGLGKLCRAARPVKLTCWASRVLSRRMRQPNLPASIEKLVCCCKGVRMPACQPRKCQAMKRIKMPCVWSESVLVCRAELYMLICHRSEGLAGRGAARVWRPAAAARAFLCKVMTRVHQQIQSDGERGCFQCCT